ncbi:MAG: hypothetical protein FWH32_06655 [Clostridiales bacterium]|nr:hypothetical protein [Clostridiales bacterium]
MRAVTAAVLGFIACLTGHARLHDMGVKDLCTTNSEISEHTDIPHA